MLTEEDACPISVMQYNERVLTRKGKVILVCLSAILRVWIGFGDYLIKIMNWMWHGIFISSHV